MESNKLSLSILLVLIVIISANFLAELFSCRFQYLLRHNMYLKHVFGLLTVIIFVILGSPLKDDSFEKILFLSSILYIIFLFLVKTDYRIFLILLLILIFLYILELKKSKVKETIVKENEKEKEKEILIYDQIVNSLTYSFYFLLPIGFLSYLGQKKKEYKNHFNFLKFMFGTSKCRENFSNDSIVDGLKHVLL
jgi:hypothetical protein